MGLHGQMVVACGPEWTNGCGNFSREKVSILPLEISSKFSCQTPKLVLNSQNYSNYISILVSSGCKGSFIFPAKNPVNM